MYGAEVAEGPRVP